MLLPRQSMLLVNLKMNIDGAHSFINGASACGDDLVCDHSDCFIKGFFGKVISFNSSLFVEKWMLRSGIIFARYLGIHNIVFYTDSFYLQYDE